MESLYKKTAFLILTGIAIAVVFQYIFVPGLPRSRLLGGRPLDSRTLKEKDAQGRLIPYIVDRLQPSVVFIKNGPDGGGTGIVLSGSGHIVTNAHVVKNPEKITVVLENQMEYPAQVLGLDSLTDIAVLKIKCRNVRPAPLGDSDSLKAGQVVLSIGSPMGLANSVTQGIVSATGRQTLFTQDMFADYIQTDAAINPGNSGGPLLNLDGQVVGMNTLILAPNAENAGIGFAIPSNLLAWVAESIIKKGHVNRGLLGVELQSVNKDLADALGLEKPEGALIASVRPDSPAQKAGLKNGDVVIDFNGKKIRSIHDLRNLVARTMPYKTVPCKIIRDRSTMNVNVTVGSSDN
jgi:serine protease Do